MVVSEKATAASESPVAHWKPLLIVDTDLNVDM